MGMSMGQKSMNGHSYGELGHGGTHVVSHHAPAPSAGSHAKVHVSDPGGFTPSHTHGGTLNVGCC